MTRAPRSVRDLAGGVALAVGLLLGLGSCSAPGGPGGLASPAESSLPISPGTSPTIAPTHFAAAGCPVSDTAFCSRAAAAASALAAGDVQSLLAVAMVETFTCDDIPAGIVMGCTPGAVLRGYGRYAVGSGITVLNPSEYEGWLASLFARVDAAYTDEHGSGRLAILGVGTCGPADPQRRSYHLAFTVALRGAGGETTQRWLGSLEFVLRDDVWVYAVVFADTVTAWQREHTDPYRQIACGNVRQWRVS